MKRALIAALLLSTPFASYASDGEFRFGAGFVGQSAWAGDNTNANELTVNTAGVYLNGRYVLNENVALDANFHLLPNGQKESRMDMGQRTTVRTTDINGFSGTEMNANFLVGLSLDERGWYAFTGLGVFKENWEYTGGSDEFTGYQVPFGLGYNFRNLSMEAQFGMKNIASYGDFFHRELSQGSINVFVPWFKLGVLAHF